MVRLSSVRHLLRSCRRLARATRTGRNSGRVRLTLDELEPRSLLSVGAGIPLTNPGSIVHEQTPVTVVVGDFNGDHLNDLLTLEPNAIGTGDQSARVTVFLATGNGTFGPAITTFTETPFATATVGDFNGDHKLDLAATNYYLAGNVSILLGNGDGTFAAPHSIQVADLPRTIVTADFNGDSRLDLAVADPTADRVSILFGAGNGSFMTATTLTANSSVGPLAVGDLNGDGKPDLVEAFGSVFLNTGDGNFKRSTFQGNSSASAIALGDFNQDNRLDLVIASPSDREVTVSFNDGAGGFGSPTMLEGATGAYGLAATGDFNGDGRDDLAAVDSGNGTVRVFETDSAGALKSLGGLSIGSLPNALVAADLTGDGKLDLVANSELDGSVGMLRNDGQGAFLPATHYRPGATRTAVVNADFNADGKLDLAVADTGRQVSVYLGQDSGAFAAPVQYPVGSGTLTLVVGDLNHDQHLDLVAANSDDESVSVLFGTGSGAFQSAGTYPVGGDPTELALGDFTGDGNQDLVGIDRFPVPGSEVGQAFFLRGDGLGSFAAPVPLALGTDVHTVAVGDFNADGRLDLALGAGSSTAPGRIVVAFGQGDGSFVVGPVRQLATLPARVVAADLNGDGKLDLVSATTIASGYSPPLSEGNVTVLLGDGTGQFGPPARYGVGRDYLSVAVADLNGDGALDVIATSVGGVRVFRGTGTGLLAPSTSLKLDQFFPTVAGFQTDFTVGGITVGEFTGNNTPDLVVVTDPDVTLFPGQTDSPLSAFVRQVYADLLGREPEATGLAYWVDLLNRGVLTRTQMVAGVTGTEDYRRQLTQRVFQQFLRYSPNPNDQEYWANALSQGKTSRRMMAEILGSDTYVQLPFVLSHVSSDNNQNAGFVRALYVDVLGRSASAAEVTFWLHTLDNGMSRTDVAQQLLDSSEGNAAAADQLVAQFLVRHADNAGLSFFASELQQGIPYEQVITQLVSSPEYFRGINLGFYRKDVTQLYRDLLQRTPSAAERDYWVNLLAGEQLTPSQLAQQLQGSQEYHLRQVQQEYTSLLKRAADPAGLQYFVSFLQAGGTIEQVDAQLAASNEYFQLRGQSKPAGFIDALFQDALQRAARDADRAYFTQLLAAGASRQDVAAAIFGSGEFHTVVVEGLYQGLLGRSADSAGLSYWSERLTQARRDEVVAQFLSTDEYVGRL